MVLIADITEEQRVKERETLWFSSTTSQLIEADFEGVVRRFISSVQHTAATRIFQTAYPIFAHTLVSQSLSTGFMQSIMDRTALG